MESVENEKQNAFLKFTKKIGLGGLVIVFLIGFGLFILEKAIGGLPISPENITYLLALGVLWTLVAVLVELLEKRKKYEHTELGSSELLIYNLQKYHDASFWMLFFTITLTMFLSFFSVEKEVRLIVPLTVLFIFFFMLLFIVGSFSKEYHEKQKLKRGYKAPILVFVASYSLIFIYPLLLVALTGVFVFIGDYLIKTNYNFIWVFFLAPLVAFALLLDKFPKLKLMNRITYPVRRWILKNARCPTCNKELNKCDYNYSAALMGFNVSCENCKKNYTIESGVFDRTLKFT